VLVGGGENTPLSQAGKIIGALRRLESRGHSHSD
jgi:hypothetical protein